MIVKNNYDECLTNLACSVKKYFGLRCRHGTLPPVDDILGKRRPENVVVIVLDGLGAGILERTLGENSFFRKNLIKNITSVFPATTTAATTSIRTGLNPVEHGWLGWNMYIEPIDKIITLFLNSEKGHDGEICEAFSAVKSKLAFKTIVDEINDDGKNWGVELLPFGDNKYHDFDDMLDRIEAEAGRSGKKYIYAYNDEPDQAMHNYGPDDERVKDLIRERDEKIEKLCGKLKNALVIVTADHGHKKVEPLFLNDYPEIKKLLERSTSLEQRAVSFKIKSGKIDEFRDRFRVAFGNDFALYDKADVVASGLFGDGVPHELFGAAVGDFIAIADESNRCLIDDGDMVLASQHAGYSDDEVMVPVIAKCAD